MRSVVKTAAGTYFRRWKGAGKKRPARSPVYKVPFLLCTRAPTGTCNTNLSTGDASLDWLLFESFGYWSRLWGYYQTLFSASDAGFFWAHSCSLVWVSIIAYSSALERLR